MTELPRRTAAAARRAASTVDQVPPAALTDPARQAVRDRRWARLTAQGSLVMAGFLGVLTQLFHGTRAEVVAEQQAQQSGSGGVQPDASAGASRFAGTVRLGSPGAGDAVNPGDGNPGDANPGDAVDPGGG